MLVKLAKALHLRHSKPKTIGSLIKSNQHLVTHCKVCGLIAYIKADSISLKPNVELTSLAEFYSCSECGYANTDGRGLLSVGSDGDE
jgi:ribosomal protein L37E